MPRSRTDDRPADFTPTEAVRPGPKGVEPREGYRVSTYRDGETGAEVPVLAASASREKLLDVFFALVGELGETVDVVLETSHDRADGGHDDLLREDIDLPVLLSHLYDFEELLLDDGSTGVAVISSSSQAEVQFDEHKLLVVYARDLRPFEAALRREGLRRDDSLKLITEGEHVHLTSEEFAEAFERMGNVIGVESAAEPVSW